MTADYDDMDCGMSAALDWLRAASDPRVGLVWLARDTLQVFNGRADKAKRTLRLTLSEHGLTATEEQARALLDAVAAWDEAPGLPPESPRRAELDAAVTAIVGERP